QVRIAAFNNLAGSSLGDLPPQHAKDVALYLLTVEGADLAEVSEKLDSFARCCPVLLALADGAGERRVTQKTAERVVGGVLGEPLQFAADEDWRGPCRKLLLQRALDVTGTTLIGADQAADILRELYKIQGQAFGMDDAELMKCIRPSQALAAVIKHV